MYQVGQSIRIIRMDGEPHYDGREGIITEIDDMGFLHGTWGGCSLMPTCDEIEVLSK